jgi:hypothetical protein
MGKTTFLKVSFGCLEFERIKNIMSDSTSDVGIYVSIIALFCFVLLLLVMCYIRISLYCMQRHLGQPAQINPGPPSLSLGMAHEDATHIPFPPAHLELRTTTTTNANSLQSAVSEEVLPPYDAEAPPRYS